MTVVSDVAADEKSGSGGPEPNAAACCDVPDCALGIAVGLGSHRVFNVTCVEARDGVCAAAPI